MSMRCVRSASVIALVAGGVFAAPALGQDSVSNANGLPGDALNAYTTGASGNQVKNYVVDLTERTSSWGSRYVIGPVAKASLSSQSTYFNHLIASQAASARFSTGSLLRPSYSAWISAGQGIGPANSTPTDNGSGLYGTQTSTGITAQKFSTAMLEFAGGPNGTFGDGDDENNVIVSMVGFWPKVPSRLYVSRIVAATNKATGAPGLIGNSTLGIGGVDEAGTVMISADGFGMVGDDVITNKKLFRVNSASRNVAVNNMLANSGPSDTAAARTMNSGTTSQTTPTLVPASIAGRPVLIGADLANNYLSEQAVNIITSNTSFVPAGASARGPLSFSPTVFSRLISGGSDAGTGAVLARSAAATKTRGVAVFAINTNGSVDSTQLYELPQNAGEILDPVDGFDPAAAFGSLGNQEFTNYQSQVVFRGGNGPVAAVVLPGGDLLVSAVVAASGSGAATPASQDNYLAVLKVSAADGSQAWTIAAHTGNSAGYAGGISKAVLGRDSNGDLVTIGRLAHSTEVHASSSTGPSISCPAMDRAGTLYFIADLMLTGGANPVPDTALLRANRNSATGGYELERLIGIGDVVAGRNSQLSYQVQFLSVADADSVDSGSVFSGCIVQDTLTGVNAGQVPYGSPLALGALVIRAKVVYDMDQNGLYVDPSLPGSGGGADQSYNVQMVLMPQRMRADIAQLGGVLGPDGLVTVDDIVAFLSAFFSGDIVTADMASLGGVVHPDGQLTVDDIVSFLSAFFAGQ
ncbi:MAG: GC-type dockerin domain-anchored protein [Phycisphaerales bacterium]